MTPWLRRPITGLALAIVAVACSSGADSSNSAAATTEIVAAPSSTESVFVDLPPPTVTTVSETTAAPIPNEAEQAAIELGAWDWGIPCRVPVTEVVGGNGPQITRTFDVVLEPAEADPALVNLRFENVDLSSSHVSELESEGYLLSYLALLPSMTLDPSGAVLGVDDLRATLIEAAARAEVPASPEQIDLIADDPFVTESVLDRTVHTWFGFWLGLDRIDEGRTDGPERQRTVGSFSYRTTTEHSAVRDVERVSSPVAPEGAVALGYFEILGDVEARQEASILSSIPTSVSASTVIDPRTLRPFYSSSGGGGRLVDALGNQSSYSENRRATFDWENADGCE